MKNKTKQKHINGREMQVKYPPFNVNFENQEMVKNDENKTNRNKFNLWYCGFKI